MVLSTSSPFFESLLKRNKHSRPLIYMRGIKSLDLSVLIDFLYLGETSLPRGNLETWKNQSQMQVTSLSGADGADVGLNGDESIVRISDVEKTEEAGQNLQSEKTASP